MGALSRAWALNLDAEHELELGARYTPSRELRARVRAIAAELARALPAGDVMIDPDAPAPVDPARFSPRAWCPTPRALDLLARAGLPRPDVPSPSVLRRVNERGLAHALSEGELPGALRATDLESITSHVSRPSITGGWLLKRGLGVAGRGQRPLHPGTISEPDRAWIAASLRRGALYVEPRVEIARELTVHGWATTRTEVRSIREQRVHERAWLGSEPARELPPALESALVDAAERAGQALIDAGYRGPFGVDAYLWRAPGSVVSGGALATRTISEINARYCMGWDERDRWDPP